MKENDSNRCRPMYLDVLVMIGCEVYCRLANSDKTLNPEFHAKWAEAKINEFSRGIILKLTSEFISALRELGG